MDAALTEVKTLPGHRIELTFRNGSCAMVNMENRVKTLRFSRLGAEKVFASAKADGDRVVWTDGKTSFTVYCTELLDAMMMD